ncbi:annexin B9-like isoform X1 [Lycorma delicatula]|uniref:annexin B9-like isoform X1 n=2 Tax=Lycorma delicatula TaxID=130591 RepID=UPI003F50FE5A
MTTQKLLYLTLFCIALCLNNVFSTQKKGPPDCDQVESDLAHQRIANMCPVEKCCPSHKPTYFDKESTIKQLEDGKLDTFIKIMTLLSVDQRLNVNKEFLNRHHKNIIDTLKTDDAKKSVKDSINKLMMTPAEIYAEELNYALQKENIELTCEILFTVSKYGLSIILDAYKEKYKVTADSDINQYIKKNGDAKNLFLLYVKQTSNRKTTTDENAAATEADNIYNNKGTSWEAHFDQTLARESLEQMRIIFKKFEEKYKLTLECFIDKHGLATMKTTYKNIVTMIKNPELYLANKLNKALPSSISLKLTTDRDLIRILVARTQIDVGSIQHAFSEIPEVKKKGDGLIGRINLVCSEKFATILTLLIYKHPVSLGFESS